MFDIISMSTYSPDLILHLKTATYAHCNYWGPLCLRIWHIQMVLTVEMHTGGFLGLSLFLD